MFIQYLSLFYNVIPHVFHYMWLQAVLQLRGVTQGDRLSPWPICTRLSLRINIVRDSISLKKKEVFDLETGDMVRVSCDFHS